MFNKGIRILTVLSVAATALIAFACPIYAEVSPEDVFTYDPVSVEEQEQIVQQATSVSLSDSGISGNRNNRSVQSLESVDSYAGVTRFDTAAMQALAAYDSSDYVIIVGDGGWADALSATGLAGILDCPILLTSKGGLSSQTASAIAQLGAKRAVVLGGPIVISDKVASDLEAMGLQVDSIAGATRQDTQLKIYEYGLSAPNGRTWSSDTVAFASGQGFQDALSFSPVAYADRVPVFLSGSSGALTEAQMAALSGGSYKTSVVLGGPLVMGEQTASFASSIAEGGSCTRLYGQTRYDTSAAVAEWSVKNRSFSWGGAAFAAATLPYDALAGSVLQGKERSVILLTDHASDSTVKKAAQNKGSISSIKFFGGVLSISNATRASILAQLSDQITYRSYSVSFNTMYNAEYSALQNVSGMSQSDKQTYLAALRTQLDPGSYSFGDDEFYQFAILDRGFSGSTADSLNSYIATHGSDGMLANMGQAFIDAANTYGINEVYLMSHAILESGWGKSTLARGFYYDGSTPINGKTYPAGTYYNFYGIGAYDSSPLSGGRSLAVQEGWDSPYDAIMGAAKWISKQYIANAYGPQNSLYRMKWDIYHVQQGGTPWKQYATSTLWATSIASVMAGYYGYCGIDMSQSNLIFEVPVYAAG